MEHRHPAGQGRIQHLAQLNPPDRIASVAMGIGISSLFHPFQYVKVLIQLGHEPLAMTNEKMLFSRKYCYYQPNVLKYLRHIRNRNGYSGLYTGVAPCVCSNVVDTLTSIAVAEYLIKRYPLDPAARMDDEFGEKPDDRNARLDPVDEYQAARQFAHRLSIETVSRVTGVVLSYPLKVIMIRQMAQFVGGEEIYTSISTSFVEISKGEGLKGFFAGLIPAVIGEVFLLWATHTIAHIIDRLYANYVATPRAVADADADVDEGGDDAGLQLAYARLRDVIKFAIPYATSSIFYPFSVVSTCTAVNGCGLAAGREPQIPVFDGWQACWKYLAERNQLKRGGKLIFRSYFGPVVFRRGNAYAAIKFKEQ